MPERLPPRFVHMLAMRALSRGWLRDIVKEAGLALQEGFDSPSLRILAGLPEQEPLLNPFEVDGYLRRSVEELGHAVPDNASCSRLYARDVAHRIATGGLAPREGCEELAFIWRKESGLPSWMQNLNEDLSLARDGIHGDANEIELQIIEHARRFAETAP